MVGPQTVSLLFGWIPQGHPQGGWSLGSALRGQVKLLLALGDAPSLRSDSLKRMGQQQLRLRARPDQLARLGWLGPGWPRLRGKAPHWSLR